LNAIITKLQTIIEIKKSEATGLHKNIESLKQKIEEEQSVLTNIIFQRRDEEVKLKRPNPYKTQNLPPSNKAL